MDRLPRRPADMRADDAVAYFEAATLECSIILITGSVPALGPIFRRTSSKTPSYDSTRSGRTLSTDSSELQHNLAHALGMNMPKLGNVVVISAGPGSRRHSAEDDITPLAPLPPTVISASKHTQVKVEYADASFPGDGDSQFRNSFKY